MFEKEAEERAKDYTENKERQVAYKCGFLDGADYNKANEWHNLRKNPNDLPERKQVPQWHKVADADLPEAENHFWSRTVLIKTNKGSSIIGFYDHANKAWYEKSTDDIVYGVIAWCEIPKYTEE